MHKVNARLRWAFYCNIVLIVALLSYKTYVNFFEGDFDAVLAVQVENIETKLAERDQFQFAVVGNINNSIGIFERKLIPMLNESSADFMISAGDAVSSGAEDKYRALYKSLSRLRVPYLLTFGENEKSSLGSFRFYEHFGPYVFAFTVAKSRFIFLDSTGKTDFRWQLRWLEEQLLKNHAEHVFVFSAHSLLPVKTDNVWVIDKHYLFDQANRSAFRRLLEQYNVDAVFSSGLPIYVSQQSGPTRHILTGGAGGFVADTGQGSYHYVSVVVDEDGVAIQPIRLDIAQSPFWRTVEGLWLFVHSLFYVGYLNFLLILSVFWVSGMWLYSKIFVERDYYPSFDIDLEQYNDSHWRVAMVTNNYLPFIGGVPISIARLRQGLINQGHDVCVVAPCYHQVMENEPGVIRVRSLLPTTQEAFRVANIFSGSLWRQVRAFMPDVIHVHHPFWLGSFGVWLAKGLRVPVVYTYHTRLEHYSHYVPLPGPLFRNLVCHSMVKRFANRCDAVIVPTESAEDYLRIIGVKCPIFVEPTGIEYAQFQSVSDAELSLLREQLALKDEKVLLSICRLSKEKNIDFILDGIKQLKLKTRVPFRLLIVGDGPERAHLQSRLEYEDLSRYVVLVGSVSPQRIAVYCNIADVFVFASVSETQGMVILEAMAAGLPVVTVRSSGINDIVENGTNGFKTVQDCGHWSDRIAELLQDKSLRRLMASNAKCTASKHSIEQFSRRVCNVYAYVKAKRERKNSKESIKTKSKQATKKTCMDTPA